MPRKPRFQVPGVPAHVVQRGNNRQPIFFEPSDYAAYLNWLYEALERYGCELHAYVLMTNHVHLLITPETRDGISLAAVRRTAFRPVYQLQLWQERDALGRTL